MNAYELARLADVASPDSSYSPGARFLVRVADAYAEAREEGYLETLEDSFHELADSAVPVYTHERMKTLVDLAAYHEDIADYGTPENMVEAAGWSLFMVAERLIHALHADAEDADSDDTDDAS